MKNKNIIRIKLGPSTNFLVRRIFFGTAISFPLQVLKGAIWNYLFFCNLLNSNKINKEEIRIDLIPGNPWTRDWRDQRKLLWRPVVLASADSRRSVGRRHRVHLAARDAAGLQLRQVQVPHPQGEWSDHFLVTKTYFKFFLA